MHMSFVLYLEFYMESKNLVITRYRFTKDGKEMYQELQRT